MTRIDLLTEASHAELDHEGIPGVGEGGGGGGPVELVYAQITSSVDVTSGAGGGTDETAGNTDLIVGASEVTLDGSTIIIVEFWAVACRPTASAAATLWLYLFDGSTSLGHFGRSQTPASANDNKTIHSMRRLTPSASGHTYSVRAGVSSGTGTVTAGGGGANNSPPAFIRVTTVVTPS